MPRAWWIHSLTWISSRPLLCQQQHLKGICCQHHRHKSKQHVHVHIWALIWVVCVVWCSRKQMPHQGMPQGRHQPWEQHLLQKRGDPGGTRRLLRQAWVPHLQQPQHTEPHLWWDLEPPPCRRPWEAWTWQPLHQASCRMAKSPQSSTR